VSGELVVQSRESWIFVCLRVGIAALRCKPSVYRQTENGLSKSRELFGATCELGKVGKAELSLSETNCRTLAVAKMMERGGGQPFPAILSLLLLSLQLLAQRQQFVYLGDNPALLGEGWKRKRKASKVGVVDCWISLAAHLSFNAPDHKRTAENDPKVLGKDQAKTIEDRKRGAGDWRRCYFGIDYGNI
jgi:hypothetical protein